MRCEDVARELGVPNGALDPVELREHLSVCSPCAEWNDSVRQFDQLWDATRSLEPGPSVWQRVWRNVSDRAEPATTRYLIPQSRRRPLLVMMALAQAAVLLIAAVTIFQGRLERVSHDVAQEGQPLFICLDTQGRRIDCGLRYSPTDQSELADEQDPTPLAWDMELINWMEGAE
jgi:hypothetical protein